MAKGKVQKINNSGQHGTITRTDDGTSDFYQFRITQDCVTGYNPVVNDNVTFNPIVDSAQRAIDVARDGNPSGGG